MPLRLLERLKMENEYVAGNGNADASIVIVGESPTHEELISQRAYSVGSRARLVEKSLVNVGIIPGLTWKTYACKEFVRPPHKGNKIPFHKRAQMEGINIEKQYEELATEISQLNPNVIVALGNTALYALTGKNGIDEYRGSILIGTNGRKVIGTWEPQLYYAEGDNWIPRIIHLDLLRVQKQSFFKELRLPYRLLRVARSSSDLYEFIKRKKPAKGIKFKLSVDIEGKECIPVCIGIAFDEVEGLTVPLWNVKNISSIPDSDLAQCWILLADLLEDEDAQIIGQNFKFDQDKINRLGFVIRRLYSDVFLKGFAINPEIPKNLAFFTSIYTEEPYYKNEGMYEGDIEELFIGCSRDCCVTFEIDSKMDSDLDELGQRPFYENFLLKLHGSYLKTESYGFELDKKVRDELLAKYIAMTEKNRYDLWSIVGTEVNTNSPKQVATLLYENFKIPAREGTGEEVLTQLLANVVKNTSHRRAIEIILEDRRVRKTISTYMMALPDYDGKMKSTYYLALDTGRTATGQQEPPIRPEVEVINWINGKKQKKVMGIAFQTMTKHGDIGADIRKQFIPEPGYVLINIDSSQAEARVVFLLANDEQALYDIDHHDYHALTASWFFGGIEDDWSKKKWGYEHPIRFCGKTLRHACHLGASKNRAALTVNTDARKYKIKDGNGELFSITEGFAGQAIKIFHAKQPSIQQNFQGGVQEALRNNKMRLHAGLPYGIEATHGGLRTFYEKWGEQLFRKAYSYIPQRSISDNTKAAKIRIESELQNIRCLVESHDALTFAIRINEVREVVPILQREMERPIDFANCSLSRRTLVIPSEVEIGDNYMEFKKYKES